MECGSEPAPAALPGFLKFGDRPKPALADFQRIDGYFLIGRADKRMDMFPQGFPAGGKFHKKLQLPGDPQLLLEFPVGAGRVIFACIHMTGRRRIPVTRVFIFVHGPFLQEYIAGGIEHQNMNGTVKQAFGMNFAPSGLTNHPVFVIHEIQ